MREKSAKQMKTMFNKSIIKDMDHDNDKFENYQETETCIRNNNVSVGESSPNTPERSASPPSLSSSFKVLPPITNILRVLGDTFLLALKY